MRLRSLSPLRFRATVVIATAAAIAAGCDTTTRSLTDPQRTAADAAVDAAMNSSVSVRGRDGVVRSYGDSSSIEVLYTSRGIQVIANRDERRLKMGSAMVSHDGDSRFALPRVVGATAGDSFRDSRGNEVSAAYVRASDAPADAPPELKIFYRNGKPLYSLRSTYRRQGDRWMVVGTQATFFDSASGQPIGEIVSGRQRGRAPGRGLSEVGEAIAYARTQQGATGSTPAMYCAEDSTSCATLRQAAFQATEKAILAYQAFRHAEEVCAYTRLPGCDAAVDIAMWAAKVANAVAEAAWRLHDYTCGRYLLYTEQSLDLANGAETIAHIASMPALYGECDDPYDGSGGGGGGGGLGGSSIVCRQEYGKIEISYDGGGTWETWWEGWMTVCYSTLEQ